MIKHLWVALVFLLLSCSVRADTEQTMAKNVLNQFHLAAANANKESYFNLMHDDFIFLGTDGSERWTKKAFDSFVTPYFSKGIGWRYTPTEQNISQISDTVLFFDELLTHKKYGQCRGSGVLIKVNGAWLLGQYNLSIPVPNELSSHLVDKIKQYKQNKVQ